MLFEITIKNFKSVKDSQTLSFEAIQDKRLRSDHLIPIENKFDLLKSAALLGSNGSGKSAFIRALEMLQGMVLAPREEKNPLIRLSGSAFAYDEKLRTSPSSISVKLILGKHPNNQEQKIYTYTVEADTRKIHREILSVQMGGSARRLYERELIESDDASDPRYEYRWGKKYEGEKKRFGRKLKAEQLFLGEAARAGSASLQDVYSWFSERLVVVPVGLSPLSEQYILEHIERHAELKEVLVQVFSSMDMPDIREVRLIQKDGKSRLVFVHGAEHSRYASFFASESLSVRRLSMLAVMLWKAVQESTFFAADDFGLLLHEGVVHKLYEAFTTGTRHNGSQLLTAGVDTVPLDEGLLRYDGIWLTTKMIDGSTRCCSLADYNIKKHDKVKEMYKQGAFGAHPIISECLITPKEDGEHVEKT
ncbi:MAG: AAA family ATPase [Spirochaetales bacterium]|jgi:hypothetical protein|nr:AAA family ATPase [Spirochaetales bacterium]